MAARSPDKGPSRFHPHARRFEPPGRLAARAAGRSSRGPLEPRAARAAGRLAAGRLAAGRWPEAWGGRVAAAYKKLRVPPKF